MFDDGHVLWAVAGPEAGEVVVEDDVENSMEAVSTCQWVRTASAKVRGSSLADER